MARGYGGINYPDLGNIDLSFTRPGVNTDTVGGGGGGGGELFQGFTDLANTLAKRRSQEQELQHSAISYARENTKHIPESELQKYRQQFRQQFGDVKNASGIYNETDFATKQWDAKKKEESDAAKAATEAQRVAAKKESEQKARDTLTRHYQDSSEKAAEGEKNRLAEAAIKYETLRRAKKDLYERAQIAAVNAGHDPHEVDVPEPVETPYARTKRIKVFDRPEGSFDPLDAPDRWAEVPATEYGFYMTGDQLAKTYGNRDTAAPPPPPPSPAKVADRMGAGPRTAQELRQALTSPKGGDEQAFQTWYRDRASKLGLDPNPDDPRHHYDYRAAFRAGAEPDPATGHWDSRFKAPDHPNRFVDGIDTITGKPATDEQLGPGIKPPFGAAPKGIEQMWANKQWETDKKEWDAATKKAKAAVGAEDKAWSSPAAVATAAQDAVDEYQVWRKDHNLPDLEEDDVKAALVKVKSQLNHYRGGDMRGEPVVAHLERQGEPAWEASQRFGLSPEEKDKIAEEAWDHPSRAYPNLYQRREAQRPPKPEEQAKPPEEQPGFNWLAGAKALGKGVLDVASMPGQAINEGLGKLMGATVSPSSAPAAEQFAAAFAPQGHQEVSWLDKLAAGEAPWLALPPDQRKYATAVAGPVAEMGAQMALDPLTHGALGTLAKGAPKTHALLSAAFTGQMGQAAYDAAGDAIKLFQKEGITPKTIAAATQTVLAAGGAVIGARGLRDEATNLGVFEKPQPKPGGGEPPVPGEPQQQPPPPQAPPGFSDELVAAGDLPGPEPVPLSPYDPNFTAPARVAAQIPEELPPPVEGQELPPLARQRGRQLRLPRDRSPLPQPVPGEPLPAPLPSLDEGPSLEAAPRLSTEGGGLELPADGRPPLLDLSPEDLQRMGIHSLEDLQAATNEFLKNREAQQLAARLAGSTVTRGRLARQGAGLEAVGPEGLVEGAPVPPQGLVEGQPAGPEMSPGGLELPNEPTPRPQAPRPGRIERAFGSERGAPLTLEQLRQQAQEFLGSRAAAEKLPPPPAAEDPNLTAIKKTLQNAPDEATFNKLMQRMVARPEGPQTPGELDAAVRELADLRAQADVARTPEEKNALNDRVRDLQAQIQASQRGILAPTQTAEGAGNYKVLRNRDDGGFYVTSPLDSFAGQPEGRPGRRATLGPFPDQETATQAAAELDARFRSEGGAEMTPEQLARAEHGWGTELWKAMGQKPRFRLGKGKPLPEPAPPPRDVKRRGAKKLSPELLKAQALAFEDMRKAVAARTGGGGPAQADFLGIPTAYAKGKELVKGLLNVAPKTVLERVAKLGPRGEDLVDQWNTFRDNEETLKGRWGSQIDAVMKHLKTDADRAAYVDLLDPTLRPLMNKPTTRPTQGAQQAAVKGRAFFDDVARLAAKNERFEKYLTDYFPRVLEQKPDFAQTAGRAANELWNDPAHQARMVAAGAQGPTDPIALRYAGSKALFPEGRGTYGGKNPNLERLRAGLMGEFRTDPELMYSYADAAAKSVASAMAFDGPPGPNGERARYGDWKDTWTDLALQHPDKKNEVLSLKHELETALGIAERPMTTTRRFLESTPVRTAQDVVSSKSLFLSWLNQMLTLGDTATVFSAMSNPVKGNIETYKGLRGNFNERAVEAATRAGSVQPLGKEKAASYLHEQQFANAPTKGNKALLWLGNKFRNAPWIHAQNKIDRAMRIAADTTARATLGDTIERIKAGDKTTLSILQHARVDPQELLRLSPQAVDAAGKYTQMAPHEQQIVDRFARKLTEKTQQRARPEDLPPGWSSPIGRAITMFMPFNYRQTKNIMQVLTTSPKGAISGGVGMLPSALVLGGAAAAARALLTGYGMWGENDDDQTRFDKIASIIGNRPIAPDSPEDALYRIAQTLYRGAPKPFALQLAQRFERAKDANLGDVLSAGVGPMGQLFEAGQDVYRGVRGADKPVKMGRGEYAARGLTSGVFNALGPSAYGYQVRRELLGAPSDRPRKEIKVPGTPGGVGRLLDLAQGKTTGEQFLEGVLWGGKGTLSKERLKRRAELKKYLKNQAKQAEGKSAFDAQRQFNIGGS